MQPSFRMYKSRSDRYRMNQNLRGKRLLILGGSLWKKATKDFAEQNGITLIATGNDKRAGIFEIADEKHYVNSIDPLEMKQLIATSKIDGVYMGGSETVISQASKYLNELNMPCYCTHTQWKQLQDKGNFKELCVRFGLPVVRKFNNIHEVGLHDFPVITKPSDGCGSSGFSVCDNYEELKIGYKLAESLSPAGSVLIEKFVPNDSVVVFYTISKGKIIFSGLEDKYSVRYPKQGSYVGGLFIFKSKRTNEFRQKFEQNITKMIEFLGITEGNFWIEVFHDGDEYYFNEVGFRYGGSCSIYPINYFYGINQVASDINFALTGESRIWGFNSLIPDTVPHKKYYAIYPIYCIPGKITAITGINELMHRKNMINVPVIRDTGTIISDTGTFSQVVALAHFVYDSELELKSTIKFIHQAIKIIGEGGQDLVAKMLDLSTLRLK